MLDGDTKENNSQKSSHITFNYFNLYHFLRGRHGVEGMLKNQPLIAVFGGVYYQVKRQCIQMVAIPLANCFT